MKKERDWKKVKDECSVVEGGGGEIHEKERDMEQEGEEVEGGGGKTWSGRRKGEKR